MMVQTLDVFVEFERALIGERILAGLEPKATRGGWCDGRRPYGLDIAADRDYLERNPTEVPLIPVMPVWSPDTVIAMFASIAA
jgi:DNA invertase Pin-like site-specific DNA recombinase